MVDKWKVYVYRRAGRKNFEAQFTDPRTGKQHCRSLGTHLKREADREAGRIEAELREGQWAATRRTGWSEFVRQYESEGMFDLSESSVRLFRDAEKKLQKLVPTRTVQDLTEEKLGRFTILCLQEGLSRFTIAKHLRYLKAALRWAVERKLVLECPVFRMPKGTSAGQAKGRAVTGEEFERMLAAVPKVVGKSQVEGLRFLLKGLWWSGLRLGEALKLSWDDPKDLMVDISGKRPFLRIRATAEKGKKDRVLPLAPEAAELLESVPDEERTGLVFKLRSRSDVGKPLRVDNVSPLVAEIGKKAGVRVSDRKTASAHDLRRSFGLRWADRVKPHVLQQLMRHASISTTLTFYVQSEASDMAELVWNAFASVSNSSDISSDTGRKSPVRTVEE